MAVLAAIFLCVTASAILTSHTIADGQLRGVAAIFCASRLQGFADGVSVCAEAADQSAAFFKKLRTLSK